MSDTIAAIATGSQLAAIGIVRLSGDRAIALADRLFTPLHGGPMRGQESRKLVYGQIRARDGALLDLGLCTVSRGPNSYTGEDTAEFQCHGSPVVLRLLLEELFALGARQAGPGEFTRRAFLNGRMDLSAAEAVADNLLELLNVAMSMMGNSKYASVKGIFDAVKRENQILACSYPTFDQLRNEIQSALLSIPFESMDLIDEIGRVSQAISAFSNALGAAGSTFPASYGVPEGAFGFWWNGSGFVRMVNGVNIALVDPASYCYPPSMWYYANSSIKTSDIDTVNNEYVATNTTWDNILNHYSTGDRVDALTQSVAITEPLQYGVGLMTLSLGSVGSEAMNLIDGCPLTGIIIGDQKDVDFRFEPGTGPSRYIYDNVIDGTLRIGSTEPAVTHTLVLQTVP